MPHALGSRPPLQKGPSVSMPSSRLLPWVGSIRDRLRSESRAARPSSTGSTTCGTSWSTRAQRFSNGCSFLVPNGERWFGVSQAGEAYPGTRGYGQPATDSRHPTRRPGPPSTTVV